MDIFEQLTRDEALRLHPYKDSVGKLTIGVGRNLDDVGISAEEAQVLLQNDVSSAKSKLTQTLPWTGSLDDARFGVLLNMTFNMGIVGLLGFKNMLVLVQSGDYAGAAQEMLNSRWADQVGSRAYRLSIQMESGAWQ